MAVRGVPLDEAVAYINKQLSQNVQPSIAVVDDVFKYVLSTGWAYYEEQVSHKHVAWHDSNRWGAGLDPEDVTALTGKIVETQKGWSWSKCGVGRAFEVAPVNSTRYDEQMAKVEYVIKAAAGYIAALNRYDIRILSVSNTHTEGVVSCIYHKTKAHNASYCTDGYIDQQKMYNTCPSIQEPVQKGLPWEVMKHQIEAAIPGLPLYIQEAENLDHGSHREETRIQSMYRLHNRSKSYSDQGKAIPWEQIAADAEKQKPILKGHAKGMCDFVNSFAG